MIPSIKRGRLVEELLALGFEKCGGFFIQKDVEKGVPYFVHGGVSKGSIVCDYREEKYVPSYETSALPQCFHTKGIPKMAGSTSQQVKLSVQLPSKITH